ncbi:MAG: hypothetical protein ACREDM_13855 [Methylocella sp.]
MPRRSTRITLSNNTDLELTLIGTAGPCHGSWTNDIPPPSTIPGKSCASWEAESSGIATGTEGWVKYQLSNFDPCQPELVFIYWDNPFIWSFTGTPTNTFDHSVTTTDVTPVCDADKGQWDIPGGFPHGGTNPPSCTHELIGISQVGNGIQGITWWDVVVNWPALLGLTVLGAADINLEFTIALRLKGSVGQTVFPTPCVGPQDIRAISQALKQPSLRALFHM